MFVDDPFFKLGYGINAKQDIIDNFPVDGLVVDWDASIRSSITDDGANVLTWTDQVSGFVATKPTLEDGPLVDAETQNGLHALTFESPSTMWLEANEAASIGNASYTFEIVFRMGDFASVGETFLCLGGFHTNLGANQGALFPQINGRCDFSGGTALGFILDYGALAPNTWHTVLITATSGAGFNVTTYLDGVQVNVDPGNPFSGVSTTYSIGQDYDGTVRSNFWEGAIGQIRMWNRALLAQEAEIVQNRSRSKWGLNEAEYPYNFIDDTRWWLDGSQSITKSLTGASITSMRERSHSQLNFVGQGANPQNVSGELSFDVIRMAGLIDFSLPNSTHPVGDDNFTFMILARMRSEGGGDGILISASTGGTVLTLSREETDELQIDSGGSTLQGTTLDDEWHLISATYDNSVGRKIYVDDALVASDSETGNNTGVTIHRLGFGSASLDMDFAEGVCLNTVWTLPEIVAFGNYLADKWFP